MSEVPLYSLDSAYAWRGHPCQYIQRHRLRALQRGLQGNLAHDYRGTLLIRKFLGGRPGAGRGCHPCEGAVAAPPAAPPAPGGHQVRQGDSLHHVRFLATLGLPVDSACLDLNRQVFLRQTCKCQRAVSGRWGSVLHSAIHPYTPTPQPHLQ